MSSITDFAMNPITTVEEAKTYLAALAASPCCYHLDDSPETVLWTMPMTEVDKARLRDRTAECFQLEADDEDIDVWEFYYEATRRESTPEQMPDGLKGVDPLTSDKVIDGLMRDMKKPLSTLSLVANAFIDRVWIGETDQHQQAFAAAVDAEDKVNAEWAALRSVVEAYTDINQGALDREALDTLNVARSALNLPPADPATMLA